ncbi:MULTISPECIES: hypothetical protein [unclassified Embleya]|uniref:hypothetical protein n=1 Tax=unclassified Embleya TaxID=2699296 RepID=UPI00340BB110
MTTVHRETFRLVPKPWDSMAWVRIPDGLEFTLYAITRLEGRHPVLPADPDEEARWWWAHDGFEKELKAAQSEVRLAHGIRTRPGFMVDVRTVRLRRYDLIPGRGRRSRRAWEHCAARMHAADAAYRPVREEIEARLARVAGREP